MDKTLIRRIVTEFYDDGSVVMTEDKINISDDTRIIKKEVSRAETKMGSLIMSKSDYKNLDRDNEIFVYMDGKEYKAKTHKVKFGRIDRLTDLYRDNDLEAGTIVKIICNFEENKVYIEKS